MLQQNVRSHNDNHDVSVRKYEDESAINNFNRIYGRVSTLSQKRKLRGF